MGTSFKCFTLVKLLFNKLHYKPPTLAKTINPMEPTHTSMELMTPGPPCTPIPLHCHGGTSAAQLGSHNNTHSRWNDTCQSLQAWEDGGWGWVQLPNFPCRIVYVQNPVRSTNFQITPHYVLQPSLCFTISMSFSH